jgi:hypothetical protein
MRSQDQFQAGQRLDAIPHQLEGLPRRSRRPSCTDELLSTV